MTKTKIKLTMSEGSRNKLNRLGDKFSVICVVFALSTLFVIMTYLTFIAICGTVDMNMNNSMLENVEFHNDNFLFNILMLFVFALVIYLYRKLTCKVNVWIPIAVCCVFVLTVGTIWVFSSQSAPTHDSLIVSRAAYNASIGDYSSLSADYFKRFPFQLGYVMFSEIIIKLFKTGDNYLSVEVVNVVCLAISYFSILISTRKIFKNDSVTKILALLLTACMPPILFCTFTYGNIPGLMFASLSIWQYIEIKDKNKLKSAVHIILSALFMGIAVCIKKNFMIAAAALIIIASVEFLRRRKLQNIICILLCVLSIIGCTKAVTSYYEKKTNMSFGDGIPMVSWLSMGLNESTIAPGWYNGKYTVTNFHYHNMDSKLAAEASKEEIKTRREIFSNDKVYRNDFFSKKIASQWNEPSYQSIWTNQVRGRYGEMGKWASYVCGDGESKIKGYMNLYQQFIFVMTALSCLIILKKYRDINAALFPAIIIGGFLYHLLFEAKSQYSISYFVLMIPLAALALEEIFTRIDLKINRKKLNK